jgi:hypothetical protein
MQKDDQTMSSEAKKHRAHLPIPTPERTGLITYDAKDPDTKFPPIEQLRPPKGAPNVLLILIDDAGFGSASAFGGPCQTPKSWRRLGLSTTASTPPPSAPRRARRC